MKTLENSDWDFKNKSNLNEHNFIEFYLFQVSIKQCLAQLLMGQKHLPHHRPLRPPPFPVEVSSAHPGQTTAPWSMCLTEKRRNPSRCRTSTSTAPSTGRHTPSRQPRPTSRRETALRQRQEDTLPNFQPDRRILNRLPRVRCLRLPLLRHHPLLLPARSFLILPIPVRATPTRWETRFRRRCWPGTTLSRSQSRAHQTGRRRESRQLSFKIIFWRNEIPKQEKPFGIVSSRKLCDTTKLKFLNICGKFYFPFRIFSLFLALLSYSIFFVV